MTGFGRATREHDGSRATVEISTVNGRGLDVRVSLPSDLSMLEPELRALISERLTRGSVSVNVAFEPSPALRRERLFFDIDLGAAAAERLRELAAEAGIDERVTLQHLLAIPGVISEHPAPDLAEKVRALVLETAGAALDALRSMQRTEGEALARALRTCITRMGDLVQRIRDMSPEVLRQWRERLEERLRQLAPDVESDEDRLAREVVFFAERSDVTEELVRIESHLQQFADAVDSDEPVGRILGFLAQELNREINTLAAKCRDAGMVELILELRKEFGSLREQIANVE